MIEIKEDVNKWRDTPCSWIRRQYQQDANCLKNWSIDSTKYQPKYQRVCCRCQQVYSKMLMVSQINENSQNNFENKQGGRTHNTWFQDYYKAIIERQYDISKSIDSEINGNEESSEINPHVYTVNESFFLQRYLANYVGPIDHQKSESWPNLKPYTKINSNSSYI